MKYLSSDKTGRIFILSLEPGDFILESIRELIRRCEGYSCDFSHWNA